jgi:hypothetical protein
METLAQVVVEYANRVRAGAPSAEADELIGRIYPGGCMAMMQWQVALPKPFLLLSCVLRHYLQQHFPGTVRGDRAWYNYIKREERDLADEAAIYAALNEAALRGLLVEHSAEPFVPHAAALLL